MIASCKRAVQIAVGLQDVLDTAFLQEEQQFQESLSWPAFQHVLKQQQ